MLEYRNNWCNHEYWVEGVQVNPRLVEVHKNGEDLGTFDVVKKQEAGFYSDHGHTYNYATYQYYVSIESPFGITFEPSLKDLIDTGYELHMVV